MKKVALGLRKKQLAFKATTHIHTKKTQKIEEKQEVSTVRAGHLGIKKMKRFLLVCKGKLI